MISNKIYRHNNPYCTHDLYVVKVLYIDEHRIKIKFRFVNRFSGEQIYYQAEPEKGTILRKDLINWSHV